MKPHFFYGGIFSQWHPCTFEIGNVIFNCAEQYMMYRKARLFVDDLAAYEIRLTDNPALQKARGRKVKGFNVDTWQAVARDIVFRGNMAKFTQNPELRKALRDTGGMLLVEASPIDHIWGIGLDEEAARKTEPRLWPGRNWLGQILTEVRIALYGD